MALTLHALLLRNNEDVCDDKGHLLNVMWGLFGMGMVVDYIQQAVKAGHLLWEPVSPKLDHLIKEIRVLVFPINSESVPTAVQHRVTLKLPLPPNSTSKQRAATVEDAAGEEDEDYVAPK
ncbi:hypothetical protein L208DRAFT_1376755 [Tricholoma matsutake]|nr:hypothetical protein L208DRAFT_1376755 [Tricholoma matsutake 945]